MLEWLLSTEMGPPGPGGRWSPWLSALFHGANLTIALGYAAVPWIILRTWKYRRDGISPLRLWGVMLFLPMQSLSRLARAFTASGAAVRLVTILDVLTAVTVVVSVVSLRPKILHILKLPSRAQIHDLNDRLQAQVWEKEAMRLEVEAKYDAIRREAVALRRALESQVWLVDTKEALARIEAITSLLNKGGHDGRG